jgi:hypothetical protein
MGEKKDLPVHQIAKLADDIRVIQNFAENYNFDNSLLKASGQQSGDSYKKTTANSKLDYPDKITLSWLREYVPVEFWKWLIGILFIVFSAGILFGQLSIVQEFLKIAR